MPIALWPKTVSAHQYQFKALKMRKRKSQEKDSVEDNYAREKNQKGKSVRKW